MERDTLAELSCAVACYLNAMAAAADCLEQACPNVGGPYRQRLHRLRARLAYDPTRALLEEGEETFEAELKDYASVAGGYLQQRSVELERGLLALSDIIEHMGQRQKFHSFRLRQIAAQGESTAASSPVEQGDPEQGAGAGDLQAAELRHCIESMERESAAVAGRLREAMAELDQRLAGTESTDPVTGLINRREIHRQIEAHTSHGSTFSLLRFEMRGAVSDQVMRQAAANLSTRFRHRDRVARWSEREFAVLFLGDAGLAERRAAQVVPSLTGRYELDNGETVAITAHVSLLQPAAAIA
jgi:GGDEF domain-containing protein